MEKRTRGPRKKNREQKTVKLIDDVLDTFEQQWNEKKEKKEISTAEALRLIELRKKIEPEEAREVTVKWVDAESESSDQ
jgi:hypothetical protein